LANPQGGVAYPDTSRQETPFVHRKEKDSWPSRDFMAGKAVFAHIPLSDKKESEAHILAEQVVKSTMRAPKSR
jgi:hypothetical protein